MSGKTYLMPGTELTEEQRASIKKFQEDQAHAQIERLKQNMEMSKVEREVLIKKLLDTKMEAIEDRVLVYPDPPETVTVGGIVIPNEVQDKQRPVRGTVIAVGPGKDDDQTVTNQLLFLQLKALHAEPADIATAEKLMGPARIPVKAGDRIMYGRFAGTAIDDEETGAELLIMRPTDIFIKL